MVGDAERARRVAWVAKDVMPHEPAVRRWLARSRVPSDQIDDFIQEAYCKLSALPSVDHIQRPDAYFFQTVRSLVTEKIRQARIVSIETFTEIDSLPVLSDDPSPERIVAARRARRGIAPDRRIARALPPGGSTAQDRGIVAKGNLFETGYHRNHGRERRRQGHAPDLGSSEEERDRRRRPPDIEDLWASAKPQTRLTKRRSAG